MRSRFYLAIILLLVSTGSQAAPTVQLGSDVGKYDLGLYADILEDPQGVLTIEQVSSATYASQWSQNQHAVPNFAFSSSAYWLRITLSSEMQTSQTWLFEVAFALQDYIDYYVLHKGKIVSESHTGDRVDFNTRSVDYHNFLFEFDISPGDTRQVFLRFQSHDGLHEPCPIILWDQQSFTLANGINNLGKGLYFGIMLVMAVYNLFIFLSVRDRVYLYYVTYIIGFCSWLTFYYGYSFQYFWPNYPNWNNQGAMVSSSFWAIFMTQFIRSFLNTKQLVPWFDLFSKITIIGLIFNIIFSFTGNYAIGTIILIGFGTPMCLATFIAGFSCLRAGFRPARYFLLAWSTLILSLIIFVLRITGILPVTFLIEKSIQIGSAIEVVLLSLALADRINVLKNEKHRAQQEAIHAFESSLKLKNDFITSINHELRTPMNAIVGGLELAEKQTPGTLKTPLDIIQQGASDMLKLVEEILTHTEIQSGQLRAQSDHFAIQPLLKSLYNSHHHVTEGKGLQLKWQADSALPEWFCTDKGKLVTILSKLLDNAIKYTETGYITFIITCEQSTLPWQLICVVKDTGIGIAPVKQQTIFESFTQSESGFQRHYGGLGIGLSICKKLVGTLGGEIRLKSTVGHGSTFTVIIPIEPGVEPVTEENTNPASADLPVLIVEDNLVNQIVMENVLEKMGYKSLIANNGKEALEILEKKPVSLMLMDLQMPVMDGFTCTEKIRRREDYLKNIPIIAVTATLMDTDKERCIECGMNDFIKKPINLEKMRNCLSSYINETGKDV